jgi:small subunit ribosomal protein S6
MAQTTKKTAPKELRTYETVCLTKVDMPEDKFSGLLDRAKKAVTENGKGEWLYNDDWGKTKISYPIDKEPRAQWTYFRFKSEPSGVDELVRGLGINEFVLRQMTLRTDEAGKDYETLRATFAKDLNERDKPREWRDPRRSRGPRGEGRDFRDRGERGDRGDFRGGERGDRGEYRSGDRGAEVTSQPAASGGGGDKGDSGAAPAGSGE